MHEALIWKLPSLTQRPLRSRSPLIVAIVASMVSIYDRWVHFWTIVAIVALIWKPVLKRFYWNVLWSYCGMHLKTLQCFGWPTEYVHSLPSPHIYINLTAHRKFLKILSFTRKIYKVVYVMHAAIVAIVHMVYQTRCIWRHSGYIFEDNVDRSPAVY